MILVDTSVWIDHLRVGDKHLANLLEQGQVWIHAYVIGELALGTLKQRRVVLDALQSLPNVEQAQDAEILGFIEWQRLHGLGIGYIDAHLLASISLTPGVKLWTRDKRLHAAALQMGTAYVAVH